MSKTFRFIALILALALLLTVFASCESAGSAGGDTVYYSGIEDFEGKTVAVITGSAPSDYMRTEHPEVKTGLYQSHSDMIEALIDGRAEAFITDYPTAVAIAAENDKVSVLDDYLTRDENAFLFGKTERGETICAEFNQFLSKLKESGRLESIKEKWEGADESAKTMPELTSDGSRGTLEVACVYDMYPYDYVREGELVGTLVEIIRDFCNEYGYVDNLQSINIDGIIAGVSSSKYDVGLGLFTITEERKESMLFSDPIFTFGSILVVRTENKRPFGIYSIDDLKGKNIGVQTGTKCDQVAEEYIEDCQVQYYNSSSDLALALERGKISGYMIDRPLAEYLLNEYKSQKILTNISDEDYAAIFNKSKARSKALCDEFNAFLEKSKADGTLNQIHDNWFSAGDEYKTIDVPSSGQKGKITLATCASAGAPIAYYKDGAIVGYDIAVIAEFCRQSGYALEIADMDYGSIFASVEAGKYDIGSAAITVTEERKQSVLFSDPILTGGFVIVSRKNDEEKVPEYSSIEELEGKKIAVITGSVQAQLLSDMMDNPDISYYQNPADLPLALESKKVEAFALETILCEKLIKEFDDQVEIEKFGSTESCFIFNKDSDKGKKLCLQMDEFIEELSEDGTLDTMKEYWFSDTASHEAVDLDSLTAENGTLTAMVVSVGAQPFVYVKDNQYAGYEIDLLCRFCEKYGYGLKLMDVVFESLIGSIESEKADIGAGCIIKTDERAESVLFSEATNTGTHSLIVRTETVSSSEKDDSSADGFIASFEKTFLTESRWKLFLRGIGSTLLITVLSVLLGTLLGFYAYLRCKGGNVIANKITDFCVWLVQGMPTVVFLMVLFYIVFGNVNLDGIWTSVIGFTLIFASAVVGMLRTGVGAIDKGQSEGAIALGYTKNQTFFKIVLPQAIEIILPTYKSEIVSLIKATAVVGYIAVQDLTKVSDVVRSRTYEAFFPLISTAVLYFVLAGALTYLVGRIEVNFNPKKRSQSDILKGVKTE